MMGDFNSKVGLKNITIIFGIEEKDERGERLIEFCKEYNLAPVQKSSNTMLDMEKSRGWDSKLDRLYIISRKINFTTR